MKKLALILISLTCIALAENGYTHAETGLVFPERLGTVTRTEVMDLTREGAGVAVSYGDRDSNVTLYVYGADGSLKEEASLLQMTLPQVWERSGATVAGNKKRKTKVGKTAGYQLDFEISNRGQRMYSQARLYDLGSHRFKMRLTGEWKSKNKLERLAALIAKKILGGL